MVRKEEKRMKRSIILLFMVALLLCGCATEQEPQLPFSCSVNGVEYYVNPETQTITSQGNEYHYRYIDDDDRHGVSITYPNGAIVSESYENGGSGGVGWSNADPEFVMSQGSTYANCYDLLSVVPEQVKKEDRTVMWQLIFFGVALIAIGWWEAACPYTHWDWQYGWRYKDAEPSEEALGRIVAFGIFQIVLGVIMVLIGIFA